MAAFNINNFSALARLSDSHEIVTLFLGGEELLEVTPDIQTPATYGIQDIFSRILFAGTDIVSVAGAGTGSVPARVVSMGDAENSLPFLLAGYVMGLPHDIIEKIPYNNLVVSHHNKLSYKRYSYFLTHSDIMIAPLLFQWMEGRFADNPKERLSVNSILSDSSQRIKTYDNKPELIRSVLVLAALSFLQLHTSTTSIAAATPAKQKEFHLSAFNDKLSLAAFVADSFRNRHFNLSVQGNHNLYSCDTWKDAQDHSTRTKTFFHDLLSESKYHVPAQARIPHENMTDDEIFFVKLSVYQAVKHLPTLLFENDFDNSKATYTIKLTEPDYILKLAEYRQFGMDMADLAILSLLKIKKFTLNDLKIKISKYTSAEINKSVFTLVLLGLVSFEKEEKILQHAVITHAPPPVQQADNRSFMKKLMERIKVK